MPYGLFFFPCINKPKPCNKKRLCYCHTPKILLLKDFKMFEYKEEKPKGLTVNFKGGGSFVKLPPQFSSDGQNIFVCSKGSILEYNTKTAKRIYEYKTQDRIIGFGQHIYDSNHCLTACTENGKVYTWKIVTHFPLSEKQLPVQNTKTFHIIPSKTENYKAVYSYLKNETIHFVLWDPKEKKSRDYKLKIKTNLYFLSVFNPSFFAVGVENHVYIVKTDDFKTFYNHLIGDDRIITCITSHSFEEEILIGDSTGRVIALQDIFSSRPKQTVFHWHTLPVQTVSFSNYGSYFYSGGGECVLVKWLFENVNDKRFVPRLPGEITHISVANNNLFIAVSTNDNGIRILDNTLNQISLIQHLVLAKHFDSGIVHDARSRSLVMNGNQGHIQFYSPDDMSLLYSIDVVGQNKITNERGIEMINTDITKVAISKSGLWFSTVEERKDQEYCNEIRLKFWKFDETKQQFYLNTVIEYPHEESINSLLFEPTHKDEDLRCVTVGNDKKFKIWQITQTAVLSSVQTSWKCYGAGFYRNLPCCSLSFSVDGSLFATGFGEILTVWTPDSCVLKCSLIHPVYKETLNNVQFGNSNQCHLLVAASSNRVSVWNILTLAMVWTVPINVAFLISDTVLSNMAVITRDKKVFVFSPDSSKPLYSNNKLLKKFRSIKACNFIPGKHSNDLRLKWYERSQLYFITNENELYCLCENENASDVTNELIEDKSLYELITPELKSSTVQRTEAQRHLYEKDSGHKALKTYLGSPLHTLAPIRFSCYSLIKSLVVQEEG